MENSKAQIWKKIALFYGLTMLFSGVFDALVLSAGRMDAGNLLYVTGSMWSPALAAFATKIGLVITVTIAAIRFGESVASWSCDVRRAEFLAVEANI